MPVPGFKEHWAMSCSLNLASCRLRAEALARQLHSNLWSPRSAQGSPGDSGCVSPCFGLPPAAAALVIDKAPNKLHPDWRMSSLDDEDEQELLMSSPASMKGDLGGSNGNVEACASPSHISPPYSPSEKMGLLPKNGAEIYGNYQMLI